jgi:hypothetical protein
MFKTNQLRDAWKGLRTLTGSGKVKSDNALTNSPGSADRLNMFYARFDCTDFSWERQQLTQQLMERVTLEDQITVTEQEVYNNLNRICTNKATGPDKVSGVIIKRCASSLQTIFSCIFNMSLSMCRFPHLWKMGEVIPVEKKPLPAVDNDLRPVTLTAIVAKCFERIVLPKLMSYVKPILDRLQFAYLPSRCTEDAINYILHELAQHLDKAGTSARCMYIDYSSAFNTMQPHILIKKLDMYGVPAGLQLWVLDFLMQRDQ